MKAHESALSCSWALEDNVASALIFVCGATSERAPGRASCAALYYPYVHLSSGNNWTFGVLELAESVTPGGESARKARCA